MEIFLYNDSSDLLPANSTLCTFGSYSAPLKNKNALLQNNIYETNESASSQPTGPEFTYALPPQRDSMSDVQDFEVEGVDRPDDVRKASFASTRSPSLSAAPESRHYSHLHRGQENPVNVHSSV
jgi:hypothetical protein